MQQILEWAGKILPNGGVAVLLIPFVCLIVTECVVICVLAARFIRGNGVIVFLNKIVLKLVLPWGAIITTIALSASYCDRANKLETSREEADASKFLTPISGEIFSSVRLLKS